MKNKINASLEIEQVQQEWLNAMAEKYQLPDPSKALRVVLDHARTEGDEEVIFGISRCLGCD